MHLGSQRDGHGLHKACPGSSQTNSKQDEGETGMNSHP